MVRETESLWTLDIITKKDNPRLVKGKRLSRLSIKTSLLSITNKLISPKDSPEYSKTYHEYIVWKNTTL